MEPCSAAVPVVTGMERLSTEARSSENVSAKERSVGGMSVSPLSSTASANCSCTMIFVKKVEGRVPPVVVYGTVGRPGSASAAAPRPSVSAEARAVVNRIVTIKACNSPMAMSQ